MLFDVYSFLCNPAKDVDLRKWAAEGLAYLTLDADVKEDLVEDTDALRSVIDLAKVLISVVVFLSLQLINIKELFHQLLYLHVNVLIFSAC